MSAHVNHRTLEQYLHLCYNIYYSSLNSETYVPVLHPIYTSYLKFTLQ